MKDGALEALFHFHDLGIHGYVFFLQIYVRMLDPVFNFFFVKTILLQNFFYSTCEIQQLSIAYAKDRCEREKTDF